MRRRYRLKNKKRFAFIISLIVLAVTFAGFITSAGASSPQPDEHKVIRVEKGDTLWEIASTHSDNIDIRKYIYNIKQLNNLTGDTIYEGQVLLLP